MGKNILINNGAYFVYKNIFDIYREKGIFKMGDIIQSIEDALLKNVNNPEFIGEKEIIKFPEEIKNKYKSIETDYENLLSNLWKLGQENMDLLTRRWYAYIPLGVHFEERVAESRPEWEQVVGELDYFGKVDFIDHENKILYTVKASKSFDGKIFNKIHKYVNAKFLYSDYEIKAIWLNTLNEELFVSVIERKDVLSEVK